MKQNIITPAEEEGAVLTEPLTLEFSGTWSFFQGPWEEAVFGEETVSLPGSMDENRKGFPNQNNPTTRNLNRDFIYTGPACYQREFVAPDSWAGRDVFFRMERTKKTRVWLDGQQVGGVQKSYTTPHVYELTGLTCGAVHTLTVEVDNSSAGMPYAMYSTFTEGEAWCHQVSEFTQTNWNGIIGEITLTAEPELMVQELKLRPDLVQNLVRVTAVLHRANGDSAQVSGIKLQAASENGGQVLPPLWLDFRWAPGENRRVLEAEYEMGEHPLRWDEFHPQLYRMTLSAYWREGDTLRVSHTSEQFGMRRFSTGAQGGGKQFLINGSPTILRGEINCGAFPKTGYSPMDLESWLRIFKIYRSYGLNHVRFHTWVPPKAAFQAADQLGFYLYPELPQWGRRMFGNICEGDRTDAEYYQEETRKIFAEYCNSPSFVMFALGNEERIGFYYYEEFLKFCKELEPDLLCSDIAGHSTYPLSADFAAKFIDPDYLPQVTPGNDWDYSETVRKAPIAITSHEVGQLQVYPDYGRELPKYESAVLKPRNLLHFREVLRQAGLEGRAAEFSRSTGKLAAMLYRSFTESYLRTPGCGGFTLLGLQDFPGQGTALIGLLDAFLESKGMVEPEVFRQSCCELTVLARMERFVWTAGEDLTAKIQIANYTPEDIEGTVTWTLTGEDGTLYGSGELPRQPIPQGTVTDCGCLRMKLPPLERAAALRLNLRLNGSFAAPNAPGTNDYRIWVYPAEGEPVLPSEVMLTRSFDVEAKRALEEGKTVLILSEGTRQALPLSRAVTFRPDFWSPMFHTNDPDGYSLGVCVDRNHPLFREFPTEEFGDWQWYELLRGARGLLINDLPVELRPMVQPMATIDLPDRLALLFEARVGNGRLFVSTVDLTEKEDKASRQLLRAVYRYLSGPDFAPRVCLEPEQLHRLLPPLNLTEISLKVEDSLPVGGMGRALVICRDSQGVCDVPEEAEVQFISSDMGTVQITPAGEITGRKPGLAKITARCICGESEFSAESVVRVGEKQIVPLSLERAVLTAGSCAEGHPATETLHPDPDRCWMSDYLDRTRQMPQWLTVELPEEATVSAVLCGAWRVHPRGSVLRGTLEVSRDGVHFEQADCREWAEETAGEDRLFAFAPRQVRKLRLNVERAKMFTGDTNAAAVSSLTLWREPILSTVQDFDRAEVRFGTPLEKAMRQAQLPDRVEVVLSDGRRRSASVVWSCPHYQEKIPGEYPVVGTLFAQNTPNPAHVTAKGTIRVMPKDMTAPPDKSAFDAALSRLQKLAAEREDETLRSLLTQAESFNARTGAVQHDVDIWTERLWECLSLKSV